MNKTDLVNLIHDRTTHYHPSQISKAAIAAVLDALGDVAADALRNVDDVPLPGLGKLKTVLRPARSGRNPKTGEEIQIGPSVAVKFSAGKTLKDHIQP